MIQKETNGINITIKIPRDWLEFAAKELNTKMDLEPPIPIDAPDEELKELIQFAAEFIQEDDIYTMPTWVCLGLHEAFFEKNLLMKLMKLNTEPYNKIIKGNLPENTGVRRKLVKGNLPQNTGVSRKII